MPLIPSANYDFAVNPKPTITPNYNHPATLRYGVIPMAFQITSPLNNQMALLPHALVMHVNPANFSESFTKKVERFQTRGGFVEQHWGDELSEISADGSTGAFMNLYAGTSSVLRQSTIAWDRYRDLHDIYRNNGDVYDPYGNIVLRGNVMLMYDKGLYIGYFSSFESEENDGSPFTFALNWNFKVEQIIQQVAGITQPNTGTGSNRNVGVFPPFQSQNTVTNSGAAGGNNTNNDANNALATQANALATLKQGQAPLSSSFGTTGNAGAFSNTLNAPNPVGSSGVNSGTPIDIATASPAAILGANTNTNR